MNPPTDVWFYSQGTTQAGPHTLADIKRLIAAGQITRQTLVWTDGLPDWVVAGTRAEFFSGAAPPPLPAGAAPGFPLGYSPPPNIAHDPTMRMLIPIGRSIWAIAAGYAGLFAVLVIFAPIALVLGIVAIIDLKKHPEKHGLGRAIFGLVMGVVFSILLVLGVIALLLGK